MREQHGHLQSPKISLPVHCRPSLPFQAASRRRAPWRSSPRTAPWTPPAASPSRSTTRTSLPAPRAAARPQAWLPDGDSQIFRSYCIRMCLALPAFGLWLRYATLQNLIPSFPWIVPGWRAGAQSKGSKGSNFAIWQPCPRAAQPRPHRRLGYARRHPRRLTDPAGQAHGLRRAPGGGRLGGRGRAAATAAAGNAELHVPSAGQHMR